MKSGVGRVASNENAIHPDSAASQPKTGVWLEAAFEPRTNQQDMIPVNSSAIRAVDYDGYTLTVEFHSGRAYHHPGVPVWVFSEFMAASSLGAYYNRFIRGRHR